MSKSLKRVAAALAAADIPSDILEMTVSTKTAAEAADAIDVEIDQIAKSIIFRGETSGKAVLFITAGGNRVDGTRASDVAGEPLGKADAAFIREVTGFAIGGVSPVGHLTPPKAYIDPRLLAFDQVWAAAGTPNHMFEIAPTALAALAGATEAAFTEEKG